MKKLFASVLILAFIVGLLLITAFAASSVTTPAWEQRVREHESMLAKRSYIKNTL